jgi:hypothetical protein
MARSRLKASLSNSFHFSFSSKEAILPKLKVEKCRQNICRQQIQAADFGELLAIAVMLSDPLRQLPVGFWAESLSSRQLKTWVCWAPDAIFTLQLTEALSEVAPSYGTSSIDHHELNESLIISLLPGYLH